MLGNFVAVVPYGQAEGNVHVPFFIWLAFYLLLYNIAKTDFRMLKIAINKAENKK